MSVAVKPAGTTAWMVASWTRVLPEITVGASGVRQPPAVVSWLQACRKTGSLSTTEVKAGLVPGHWASTMEKGQTVAKKLRRPQRFS